MSSSITTSNGVRIFTVVVLSGSLFILIYRTGRRRLEQQEPKPDSARTPRTERNSRRSEGQSKRYFSHHCEKSYPGVSSFSQAVECSKSNLSKGHEHTETRSRYGTDDVHDEASTVSDISDVETDNPYIFSATDAALRHNLENRGKRLKTGQFTDTEQSFLEHLGQRSSQEIPSTHAGATSPGDLSSFENGIKDQKQEILHKDAASSSRAPIDAFQTAAAEKSSDRGGLPREQVLPDLKREIPSSTYHPTTSSTKPLLYCFMWCILSQSLFLYSRTGMGATMVTFPAPFFRITVHFIIQGLLASCMLRWPTKKIFYTSWTTFLWRVVPVAVAATMDHEPTPYANVCENQKVPVENLLACKYGDPLTNYGKALRERTLAAVCQVQWKCKAWVPVIAFLLATAYKLDGQGHSVFPNVLIISLGFMLAAYKQEDVENWSLTGLSVGSFVSAFRLVATQNLLQNRGIGLVTPVVTMRALAPAMALVTASFSYFVDPWSTLRLTEFFDTPERSLLTWAHITVGALLETSVALAELVVIYHTSANTMIIVALLKEVAFLTVDRFHHHDYTRLNAIGVGVFTVGVLSYAWLKYRKMIKHVRFQDHPQSISPPTGEESSCSGGRSFLPANFLTRTRARIWTELSSCVDRVLQVTESLRIMSRAWTDRFSLFRRFLRQ